MNNGQIQREQQTKPHRVAKSYNEGISGIVMMSQREKEKDKMHNMRE